jgi:pantoate--beta-alanine ligase
MPEGKIMRIKVFTTTKQMREYVMACKKNGQTIGLVPTMGALHDGHLSLMQAAKAKCDVTIASVFVNPVQFGPNEDYDAYPRQFEADCQKLDQAGVDAVFHPSPDEMYPEGYTTYVTVDGSLTNRLCGASRPGHFRGVATVVTKLLNITQADRAFFGQKDAQQVVVISRFVRDLNIPVQIEIVPIFRAASGLALSSRNAYLSEKESEKALVLSKSLQMAKEAYQKGEVRTDQLKNIVKNNLQAEAAAKVEYVELYSFPDLKEIDEVQEKALLAIAVKIGTVRLIDNVLLEA